MKIFFIYTNNAMKKNKDKRFKNKANKYNVDVP